MEQTATQATVPDQPVTDQIPAPEPTDVFAWANNLFLYKDKLQLELFLLSKNDVVYRTRYAESLSKQLHPLFIDVILEYVITGAGKGLTVREFEAAEAEEMVLQRTSVKNVDKLMAVMSWFGPQAHQVEDFIEADHDLKRSKAIIARCTHPELPKPFYIIKALSTGNILKGVGAWVITGNKFESLDDGAALRIPPDNQLLIIDDDLYVFNQSKLERLFGYNAKKNAIAEQKVREIEANFNLSFADEQDLQTMVKDSKTTINKLQKVNPTLVTQQQLLDHADEMDVELMTDDNGAIIIMDQKDLGKFVNLLNDDYIESPLTGFRYEIKSKKLLRPDEAES